MTDRETIIAKILKCLALAKSANEHEAAAALRQAQKLMAAHGVTDLDIAHADIQEESTRAGVSSKPARWECGLALRVARTFSCETYFVIGYPVGRWVFVGASPSGEIARYAFEVMFRQVKRARAAYIKAALKRIVPKNRTRRADLFCEGWMVSATALIERLAGNDEQVARIAGYLKEKHNLGSLSVRDRNAGRKLAEREWGDFDSGHAAGNNAQLNRGVGGAGDALLASRHMTHADVVARIAPSHQANWTRNKRLLQQLLKLIPTWGD